jgi:hypothetical protein
MPKKVIPANPTRSEMVDFICEDLRDWEKRDSTGFWEHVDELERAYLRNKPDKEVKEIYNESI